MEYEITGVLDGIIIGATGLTEIFQNVKTILATTRGSVPLDRTFGLDAALDEPLPIAWARMAADIVAEVEKQEPRVRVSRVDFKALDAAEGRLAPVVYIRIREGAV
jgi:uncharacterized protein